MSKLRAHLLPMFGAQVPVRMRTVIFNMDTADSFTAMSHLQICREHGVVVVLTGSGYRYLRFAHWQAIPSLADKGFAFHLGHYPEFVNPYHSLFDDLRSGDAATH